MDELNSVCEYACKIETCKIETCEIETCKIETCRNHNFLNLPNVILEYMTKYFTRLEIFLLSHVNNQMRCYALRHTYIGFGKPEISPSFKLYPNNYESNLKLSLESAGLCVLKINNLCVCAGNLGYLAILKYFAQLGFEIPRFTFLRAAMNNHLKILIWALQEHRLNANILIGQNICAYAAFGGHLKILEWARKNKFDWSDWAPAYAALNGHFEVLKWLRKQDCPWDSWTCSLAALNGHLNILKWANENGCRWADMINIQAAQNGHLDVIQWSISNGRSIGAETFVAAACNGHLNIFTWAVANNILDLKKMHNIPQICINAASYGHLNILEWAISNNMIDLQIMQVNLQICIGAAKNGHLNILEWAISNNMIDTEIMRVNPQIYIGATNNGHLNIVDWALSNNMLDIDIFRNTFKICIDAKCENFNILKWALSNGIINSEYIINNPKIYADAAKYEQLTILELVRTRFPNTSHLWIDHVYMQLVKSNKLAFFKLLCNTHSEDVYLLTDMLIKVFALHRDEFIKFIIKHDITLNDKFRRINASICLNAVKMKNLDFLIWARNNGCDWNDDVCNNAILNDQWHIVKWATDNGCEWNDLTIKHILSKKVIDNKHVINVVKNMILQQY